MRPIACPATHWATLSAIAGLIAGCGCPQPAPVAPPPAAPATSEPAAPAAESGAPKAPSEAPPAVDQAIATIRPTQGNRVRGTVSFTPDPRGLRVIAKLQGLEPGPHGFHVHQLGDCSAPDGTSAGGHYAPRGKPHGAPTDAERHVGDLGNVVADTSGRAELDWVDPLLELTGPRSVLGRAVIVHGGADDLESQPTGAAGARVGCGVIGVAAQ